MKSYWWILIVAVIVIILAARYFVSGKGNKSLICPTLFGFGWDRKCVEQRGCVVVDSDTIDCKQ